MHESAMAEAAKFAERLGATAGLKIADIGSRDVNGSMRSLFPNAEYVGFDIVTGVGVDILMMDPETIPAETDIFDAVISANCLEHTRRPWTLVQEMARVAKPGGRIFVLMPECHPYHPYPIDCWRAYPEGIRGLLENAGLKVDEVYENGHDSVGIARKP